MTAQPGAKAPELVILVPVLRRPHRVRPLLRSIWRATSTPCRVLFIADPDDEAQRRAIDTAQQLNAGPLVIDCEIVAGSYARKINAGVAATNEPLVFLGADDLEFHPGWLDAAVAELVDGIGVVGTQDLCNRRVLRGEHATHFLLTRDYAELPTIDGGQGPLCELYPHEYVDNELVLTAQARRAWAFAHGSVVEHLHPMVGKAPMDDLYAASRQRMRAGRLIFDQRRHLWETP